MNFQKLRRNIASQDFAKTQNLQKIQRINRQPDKHESSINTSESDQDVSILKLQKNPFNETTSMLLKKIVTRIQQTAINNQEDVRQKMRKTMHFITKMKDNQENFQNFVEKIEQSGVLKKKNMQKQINANSYYMNNIHQSNNQFMNDQQKSRSQRLRKYIPYDDLVKQKNDFDQKVNHYFNNLPDEDVMYFNYNSKERQFNQYKELKKQIQNIETFTKSGFK